MNLKRHVLTALFAGLTSAATAPVAWGQAKTAAKTAQAGEIRIEPPASWTIGRPRTIVLLESVFYGSRYYYSSNQPKFFAARVLVVNLSHKPVTLKRDAIRLLAAGKAFKVVDIPAGMRFAHFYVGTDRHTLGELKLPRELTVKPGEAGSTWVVFLDIAKKNDVPPMTLQLPFDAPPVAIDVNAFAKQQMEMTVERIGPRGGLGLVTIAGSLNTVNVGSLVEEISELAKKKVVRVVIRWTKSATKFDSNMQSWIVNEANTSGRAMERYSSYPFPDIPATVRELHLAQMPNGSSYSTRTYYGPYGSYTTASRVHKTDAEAVSAALKSAYEVLPADELVREIEDGHPLTRAAALAAGGGRLPADKLGVVLKYAQDKDPRLQLAAVTALAHFGEPEAIARLAEFVHHKSAALSRQAVISLASSRFAAAHHKLLAMLKTEPAASKKKIVQIVAQHPRPIWSETIYEFARDPDSGVGADALKALGAIGHPKLVDVLEASLKSRDKAIRDQAFVQLSVRSDARSERIALEFTLNALKTAAPTPQMYELLKRTKDPRAIPLLLEHLDKTKDNNSTLIDTLATIGDQSVGDKLADRYPKMKSDYSKSYTLRALIRLKSPRFRKLAGEALMTRDSSLIGAACDGLREDASPEAVRLMISALDKSTYSTSWSYTANSLSQIGTPEARAALIRARNSANSSKRTYAISALRSLTQRSPGYQYIYRATESVRQNKLDDALKFYNLALKLDDDLSVAYSGRGLVLLRQKKVAAATKDFATAESLDPYDIDGVTGSAVLLGRSGKHAEAVTKIEKLRSTYSSDRHYLYSAARIYSVAVSAAARTKATPARKTAIDKYQKQAMKDLTAVFKQYRSYYSFPKPEDVKNEPDFDPLRKLPDYIKLFNPTGTKKAGAKAS